MELTLVLARDDRRWNLMDLDAPADSKSSGSAPELTVVDPAAETTPAGNGAGGDANLAA
jgi:hypothetical protein